MLKAKKLVGVQVSLSRLSYIVCAAVSACCLCSLTGCDTQKIDSYLQGPTKLSGNNSAIGGINYAADTRSGNKGQDLHISICRFGETHPGSTWVRLGSGSDNLPLNVVRDDSGKLSFTFAASDGVLSGSNGDGCTIKLVLNPSGQTAASGQQRMDGETRIACTQGGKSINASARFQHCGD